MGGPRKWVIAAVVAVATGVAALWWTRSDRTRAAPDELRPNAEMIRYKFAVTAAPTNDLASTISALEARDQQGLASPFDLADLADAYTRSAQALGDPTAYDRATAVARRSLQILPFPNGAALVLAKIANANHQFRDAIRIATEFSTHKPSASAQILVATAHLALGELAQAAAAAEAAVVLKPDRDGYVMRALVLQAQGRDAEAAFDFGRSVAVEPPDDVQESARRRVLWGRFLLRRGEYESARALFREALRIVPGYPLALGQTAELALRTGDIATARATFERAFAASRQVRYLIDLARAQELGGDLASATNSRTQVEKLVRADLASHATGHKLELIEVLVDRGRPADLTEAIALGREELASRPSADTRFQLARALYRSGARDQAALQVHAALATGVRDARLYELASRLETGPRQALYARQAAALDPGNSGWRRLGMASK